MRYILIFSCLVILMIGCKANSETSITEKEENFENDNPVIVWLGDSISQGSLGDDGDNLPGAPYNLLAQKYNLEVEGYGFYGNNTHDVLWRYKDETQENQKVDPDKVYIFWLGLNDWVDNGSPNTDTEKVINELDTFITNGQIDKYIIMGPTARIELRNSVNGSAMYDIIDSNVCNHYGQHYLRVLDTIGLDGFGPDGVHLTNETYEKIADLVHEKLVEMNYL